MKYTAAAVAFAAIAGSAHADEVVLRNGARFEGQVRESGDTVTVVMDFGSMTFRKMDVAKIDRGPSALVEFDAKVVLLKADDLDGKYRLAMWALKKDLLQRARNLLEDILSRHPDHAGAREALGYRRVGDRWLTEEEHKAEQGLVLFRGEWVGREMADEIRRIEAERASELARIAAEEAATIRILQAEAREARIQEEAARAWEEYKKENGIYENSYYPAAVYPTYGFSGGFSCFQKPIHMGNAVFYPGGGRPGSCGDGGAFATPRAEPRSAPASVIRSAPPPRAAPAGRSAYPRLGKRN